MKKLVFAAAVVAAMVFCTDASAQRYNSARVGLMGGFTSSSTSIKNMDSKSVSLYHVGLTAEIPLLGGFAIQPGLLYQVKGVSADKFNSIPISKSLESFETKVGYLEVPVQVQWGLDLLAFRPYVFAEPFVGFRLGQSTKVETGDKPNNNGVADKLNDNLKKVEYGLGLGAGVDVWRLQLSVKYFWNFGKIYDKDGNVGPIGDTVKDAVKDAVNNGNNFNGVMVSAAFFF